MMQLIGLVFIAIICVRNIIRENIDIFTNSLKLAGVFVSFVCTGVYTFLMSIRKSKEFLVGCDYGKSKWIFNMADEDEVVGQWYECTEFGFDKWRSDHLLG